MDIHPDELMIYQKSGENAFAAGKKFYKFVRSQEFSLPSTVMEYLWKYPSNPERYKKLIQSCKFFFAKNPILICPSIFTFGHTEREYWQYCSKYHDCFLHCIWCFRKKIILEKADCKFWPITKLDIRHANFPHDFLPKLYRSDAKRVFLHSRINYLSHIHLLASSAVELSLADCILDDENGQQIFVEDFIESFPMLQKLQIYWNVNEKSIPPSRNYEKLLITLQKFPNFEKFIFNAVPDNFNIQTFLKCVKHLKIQFKTQIFYWNESSAPEFNNHLQETVDDLLETKVFDYFPTLIWSYHLEKKKPQTYFDLESKIEEYKKEIRKL